MKIKKEKDGTYSITGMTFGKLLAMQSMCNAAEKANNGQLSAVQEDVRNAISTMVNNNHKGAEDTQEDKLKKLGIINNTKLSAVGTSLAGYIHTDYKKIVELLGKPHSNGDGYKVDAEWNIEMNGKVLTIYNYKDGKNYNGRNGLATKNITEWHIGAAKDAKDEIIALGKALAGRVQLH